MSARWGDAIHWHATSELEGYEEDSTGGPDWPTFLAPKTRDDFVGNEMPRKQVHKWFEDRSANNDSSLLILMGPIGSGKTCTVEVESTLRGIHLVHMAADEPRSGQIIDSAMNLARVPGCMLFLDDANNLAEESTGLVTLTRALRQTLNNRKRRLVESQPLRVIVCLDETKDPKLRPLLHLDGATTVQFQAVPSALMVPHLRQCALRLDRRLSYFEACKFAHFGQGDIRRTLMLMHIDGVGSGQDIKSQSRTILTASLAEKAAQEYPGLARALVHKHFSVWPQHFPGGPALCNALSDATLLLSVDAKHDQDSAGDTEEMLNSAVLTYSALGNVVYSTWGTLQVQSSAIDSFKARPVRVPKVPKSDLGQW
jgi:hypothetical protein